MKIISFTIVKDEEDIIESFVRYNITIVDKMVIYDNCSNDNTLIILKKLKNEGLDLDIIEDKNQYFDEVKMKDYLLRYTFNNFNPDFAIPLDADEFIGTYDNINPRIIIEKLNKKYLYRYKMINYVITKNDDNKELFIPLKMKYHRTDFTDEENTYKCFISNKIYNNNLKLLMGCHNAYYSDNKKILTKSLDNIFIAHYPIRSKKQIMNKVIIGRLNSDSLYSRNQELGFHQYEILDEIIKNNDISNSKLYYFSKYYGIKNKNKNKIGKIIKKTINISFCNNITIKYTDYKKTNILSNTIKTSEIIINKMRNDIDNKNIENIKLQMEYDKLYKSYIKVINSKRWIFISKICNLFH